MDLKNKVALVTGASRGIGRQLAIELAMEGCEVIAIARDLIRLKETQKQVEEVGGKCQIFPVDLRNIGEINKMVEGVKNKYPQLHILCNVAGIYHSETQTYFDIPFDKFSDEAIVDSIDVGVKASMLLAKAFIPLMKKGGRIINTSGTFGGGEREGLWEKGCMADLVTKKAIEIFTKQLAYELEGVGITVNAICPWYTWTENVQKFFPDVKDEAIPVVEVARKYIELLKSEKSGEIVEIRK